LAEAGSVWRSFFYQNNPTRSSPRGAGRKEMSDIVKVLRGKYALDYDEKTLDKFCNEAADEIEKLRAALQDLLTPQTPASFARAMKNARAALGEGP